MINLQGKSPKILVIGDLMIDNYLWGSSERISPEAPVPIVNIDTINDFEYAEYLLNRKSSHAC